jgi:predicted ester cyclase
VLARDDELMLTPAVAVSPPALRISANGTLHEGGEMADPKEVVDRHLAAFNAKDRQAEPFSAHAEVVAPGAQPRGREQILDWLGGYWEGFPDARNEIARSIEAGPLVAAEGKLTGTHTGPLRTPQGEVQPTGRSVEIRWMAMYEVRGDELVSEQLYFDTGEFMTQLGLAPAPAEAGAQR